ncbi:MAG: Cytoplasmic chaperone TorD [Rhodospirillaceae bacterium]|nr:MAG: Cytoplasmic chaperone TorD [Rhodospirillaceae bacterium]
MNDAALTPAADSPLLTVTATCLASLPLLAQADLLLAAARLFRPPAADLAALTGDLAAAAGTLVHGAGLPAAHAVVETLTALAGAVATTPPEELTIEYVRLFEGEMACPPNETAYIRRDKGAVLGDIAGFYHAFGVATAACEKPDHVAAELEFMAALLVMQVKATTTEKAETARHALSLFVADHAGDRVPSFTARLAAVAALPSISKPPPCSPPFGKAWPSCRALPYQNSCRTAERIPQTRPVT